MESERPAKGAPPAAARPAPLEVEGVAAKGVELVLGAGPLCTTSVPSVVRVMLTAPVALGSKYSVATWTPSTLFSVLCAFAADLISMKATVAQGLSFLVSPRILTLWILPYLKENRK